MNDDDVDDLVLLDSIVRGIGVALLTGAALAVAAVLSWWLA